MKIDQLPSLVAAQTKKNKLTTFIEIGTWEGDFSFELLTKTNCNKLYCIDPYKHFDDSSYPDGMNLLTQKQFDNKYNIVKQRFNEFGSRVEFIRDISYNAVKLFDNESIDFIYIDGNHDYKYVLEDILIWYPKVMKGGYLCGDDIHSVDMDEHDSDGNVLRVWSTDAKGKPSCYGKYGTYAALLKASSILNFNFIIDGTQFIIQK
jgi:hypothetical protein